MIFTQSNMKKFLYTPGMFFEIPEFQRPYSWQSSNVKEFLADLEECIEKNKKHYFGTVVQVEDTNSSYSNAIIDGQQRQRFTDEIEKIRWTNKISPDTLNISSGEYSELQVFEITLKLSDISTSLLKHIDTFIPYPILYILKKSNQQKAVISFKEQGVKYENQMKVDTYFETQWLEELELGLKGRSVDEIYKNFLFQIAPKLSKLNQNEKRTYHLSCPA